MKRQEKIEEEDAAKQAVAEEDATKQAAEEEDAAKHMRWALAEQAVAAQDMLTTTCIPQP